MSLRVLLIADKHHAAVIAEPAQGLGRAHARLSGADNDDRRAQAAAPACGAVLAAISAVAQRFMPWVPVGVLVRD